LSTAYYVSLYYRDYRNRAYTVERVETYRPRLLSRQKDVSCRQRQSLERSFLWLFCAVSLSLQAACQHFTVSSVVPEPAYVMIFAIPLFIRTLMIVGSHESKLLSGGSNRMVCRCTGWSKRTAQSWRHHNFASYKTKNI